MKRFFSSPPDNRQDSRGFVLFFSPGNETKQNKIEVVNQMKNEKKIRKEEYQTIRTGNYSIKNMYIQYVDDVINKEK